MSKISDNAGNPFVTEEPKAMNGHKRPGIDPLDDLTGHINGIGGQFTGSADAEEEEAKPESGPTPTKWETQLLLSEIKATDEITKPPVCLAHEVKLPGEPAELSTIGTLGNFSVITGKAKSRKTFVVSVFVAAMIADKPILKCIRGFLPENQKTVLYFDTEQGRWHAQRVLKRICRLSGIDTRSTCACIRYALTPLTTG